MYSPSLGRIAVCANISCALKPHMNSLRAAGPSVTSIAVQVLQSACDVVAEQSRMSTTKGVMASLKRGNEFCPTAARRVMTRSDR